jgi:regulator of chromosome condensation
MTAGAGEPESFLEVPTIANSLNAYKVIDINGGHYSIARCKDGMVLTLGRCDDVQKGSKLENLPSSDFLFDSRNCPYSCEPSALPNIHGVFVAGGIDDSIVLNNNGERYL